MSENSSKQLAEKIHMFYNLLYHIDDYIKNKKERKGQLRVSKNIRLILREIISSKINLNYFINKEELDSYKIEKKSEEIIKKERQYIKTINPLSFNQKNLDCINLFYNSNNEMYVINYLSIEKIFSIVQYCFIQIMKQKNIESKAKYEKENKNFVLYNTEESEIKNLYNNKIEESNKNSKNDILNKMIKRKNFTNVGRLFEIDLRKSLNDKNPNNSVNVFSIINNSYKLNNIPSILNNNYKKKYKDKGNNLKMQIKKINNQMNISLIRANSKKTLKKNLSLPLINVKKLGNNKNTSYYRKENNKDKEYNYSINKTNKIIDIRNNIQMLNGYDYNKVLPLYNIAKKIVK